MGLQAALCTVVIGAPRPSRPSGLCVSNSALAVKKGSDAYVKMIGFHRKRESNPMNKKDETMKEKSISFGQGHGSLTHNNREFMAANVDTLRTPENITFVCQPIGEAYEQLFAESTARYNARQKRNDRKIHGSYYKHLFGVKPCNTVRTAADKRKSFYEDVVQIGKMEDSGYGTEDFQLVAECLKEYIEGFQKRNPNFYVFNAVLHMDEATPHLHIDYIPVGHYKRGQDTQNGIAQALKEMGYGEGKMAIAKWRAAEVEVLNKICLEHGIKPLAPEKSRGTLMVEEYKEQRHKADELAEQNQRAETELAEKCSMLKTAEKKTARLVEIESIETGKTVFGGKVTVSQEDWDNVTVLAKKEVASQKQTKKLRKERDEAVQECDELKAKLSAVSSELAVYKKKEEEKVFFTREKLNKESKRITREEQLTRNLQKALIVIDQYGLRDEYNNAKLNTAQRKTVLE
ncbi:plasmid recombination protein [Ruminococcus sp.]